jgi:hypothetical protein
LSWFRLPKQAALQGEFRLGISGFRHGSNSGAQIVRVISGCSRRRGRSNLTLSV